MKCEYGMLVTPENIQGELIKNQINQLELQTQALKEQKYRELLRENQQLKEQQKEFISWLIENESLDDYCNETTFTSIREKYEEIIGSDVK